MVDPLPLATYSFVMSITPGPNNIMLTAAGATHGFRRTVPHLLGVAGGLVVQLVACCAGLGALFARWPALHEALRWLGAAYLVYLGWRMLGSPAATDGHAPRPITFLEAALFQFVNPKAWVMSITATTLFLPTELGLVTGTAYVAGLMGAVNLPCVAVWALFGTSLRRMLSAPPRRMAFQAAMALALAVTGVMMVA